MAVALGKVALPDVLVVVVVVEELVVVVALGVLVVGVPLIILVVFVTPGILVVVVVIGKFVVFIALGVFVVNVIGEGLVIVVCEYGASSSSLPLARSSLSPLSPTAYLLLLLAMSPSYWHTLIDHGSCLYFFVIQFATPYKETGSPHTLRHSHASSPSSLPSLTPTID
jgi:hypothetical protein